MKRKPLADHIADYYLSCSPRPSTLSRLERMTEAVPPRRRLRRMVIPAAIAASALTLILVLVFLRSPLFVPDPEARTRQIAVEIAANHKKNLAPQIMTPEFGDLVVMSDQLGFTPGEPDLLRDFEYQLEGARYCSVKGHLAVQISLTAPGQRRATLYQLPDADTFPNFRMTAVALENLEVTLWREGSFFFGLAEPLPSEE